MLSYSKFIILLKYNIIKKSYYRLYDSGLVLVFKKLKQNFQLHFFYSESENGIKTQVWATLIAHLLLTAKSNKAFSTMKDLKSSLKHLKTG